MSNVERLSINNKRYVSANFTYFLVDILSYRSIKDKQSCVFHCCVITIIAYYIFSRKFIIIALLDSMIFWWNRLE